ncbi:MAG TPA: LamG domain-containing protein [Thermoanaerobaculia bacterium]|nr:LamG domain-containing protein [Thermoanaerobaculia bacterium]
MRNRYAALFVLSLIVAATPAAAQPYGAFFVRNSGQGYVEVPHSSVFDFSTGFTFEAWVSGSDAGPCSGIAGKQYTTAWWIGVCGTTLRSYIKGTPSLFDGGKVPANEFVHIAVTYDGATRKHYIDGELVASRADSGPMTTNTQPMRFNSDVAYSPEYANTIDEVRLWNVARTQDELRSGINKTINTPQTGLVAVYHLDGNANDAIAGHHGTTNGTGAYLTSPVALTCGSTNSTQLCLTPNRFSVTSKWQLPDGTRGVGTVVPGSNSTSGLFWFFGSDNWELLVKVLDGCPVNNNKWVFSAATTNVHYQLAVTDVKSGQTKRYFNYFGQSAPAVTDTEAFATCP